MHCGKGCQRDFGDCHNGSIRDLYSHESASVMQIARTSSRVPTSYSTPAVSKNGRCGAAFGGVTCNESQWGSCCSKDSVCGSTKDHCCPDSCQKGYGRCDSAVDKLPSRPSSGYAASTPDSYSRAAPTVSVSSVPYRTRLASDSKSSSSPSYSDITHDSPAAGYLRCGPQAASCSKLPAVSAKSCSELISKSKLRIATCSLPASTITGTYTVTPDAPSTVITDTATSWTRPTKILTFTQNATITVPQTTTTTSTTTA